MAVWPHDNRPATIETWTVWRRSCNVAVMAAPRSKDSTIDVEALIVGGGLAGMTLGSALGKSVV